jgi:outer membrane protein assembly factor BamA
LLCAVFNACTEADRESFVRLQRLGVLSASITRETGDNPLNPTQGSVVRLEVRTAGAFTGSDAQLRFSKILTDGSIYRALGRDIVLAARLRFGAVVGDEFSFSNRSVYVPPQERLFAGGPTTVRGFRQNELGPALYIPTGYDTVRANGTRGGDPSNPRDTVYFRAVPDSGSPRVIPTGGNALIVANLEARLRSPVLPDIIQWTVFADVGDVWNRGSPGSSLGFSSLRWSPGLGVRVRTLIGFLRLDVAYNPYQRPPGSAYFDTPIAAGGALLCVSPGNTLRVTSVGGQLQQDAGSCPASFQPPRETSFLRRLTPSISIGQAF